MIRGDAVPGVRLGLGPFELEAGGRPPSWTVADRGWGRLSPLGESSPLVCHALAG